jgi:hypothetical protein
VGRYRSYVLIVVPGEGQCVCKSAIALYLNVIKRNCNQGANKSNHPNYNLSFSSRVPPQHVTLFYIPCVFVLFHVKRTSCAPHAHFFEMRVSLYIPMISYWLVIAVVWIRYLIVFLVRIVILIFVFLNNCVTP